MIVVRIVFRARYGKINELVEEFKRQTHAVPNPPVILTDLSGAMNTMVMERRHESLAAAEQFRAELFRSESFQQTEARSKDLIEAGWTEYYTIEQG